MKNLLVIGAGASHGSRAINVVGGEKFKLVSENAPPLGAYLAQFLQKQIVLCLANKAIRVYRGNELFACDELMRLNTFFESAIHQGLGYEAAVNAVIEKAEHGYITLLELLNRFIAFAFSYGDKFGGLNLKAFEPRIDLYSSLIRKLNISVTDWVVVSLNYDTLFEQALISANKRFEYAGIQAGHHRELGAPDAIKIFKIHGSMNWYGDDLDSGILTINDELPYPVHEDETIYSCELGHELNEIRYREKYPVMAHYEPRKGTFRNFKKLQSIREQCLAAASECSAATIIGMTLPSKDDDKTVYCLVNRIAQSAKIIEYVSPSKEDCDKMQRMSPRIKCSPETFAQWLGVTA